MASLPFDSLAMDLYIKKQKNSLYNYLAVVNNFTLFLQCEVVHSAAHHSGIYLECVLAGRDCASRSKEILRYAQYDRLRWGSTAILLLKKSPNFHR